MSVYQIVYCSKNCIDGSPDEIADAVDAILLSARSKNRNADVSGALLFNGSAFAQVLEGPLASVEEIFEQIQCDPRHSDVVLLRNEIAPERIFSDWSMAYADPNDVHAVPNAEIDLNDAFSNPSTSGPRVVNLLQKLVARHSA